MKKGSVKADESVSSTSAPIEKLDIELAENDLRIKSNGIVKPEGTGIDVTSTEIIVSVGRGIGQKMDLKMAEELAEAIKSKQEEEATDNG